MLLIPIPGALLGCECRNGILSVDRLQRTPNRT